jgi:hypothetical protein
LQRDCSRPSGSLTRPQEATSPTSKRSSSSWQVLPSPTSFPFGGVIRGHSAVFRGLPPRRGIVRETPENLAPDGGGPNGIRTGVWSRSRFRQQSRIVLGDKSSSIATRPKHAGYGCANHRSEVHWSLRGPAGALDADPRLRPLEGAVPGPEPGSLRALSWGSVADNGLCVSLQEAARIPTFRRVDPIRYTSRERYLS